MHGMRTDLMRPPQADQETPLRPHTHTQPHTQPQPRL